jgi:hypothetical protein
MVWDRRFGVLLACCAHTCYGDMVLSKAYPAWVRRNGILCLMNSVDLCRRKRFASRVSTGRYLRLFHAKYAAGIGSQSTLRNHIPQSVLF